MLLVSSLLSLGIMTQIHANTKEFGIKSFTVSNDIQAISDKIDVQSHCTPAYCEYNEKDANEGVDAKYINKILALYDFDELNPNHDNFVQLGYYDTSTGISTYPASCMIHINSFPANQASVKMTKNGCTITAN